MTFIGKCFFEFALTERGRGHHKVWNNKNQSEQSKKATFDRNVYSVDGDSIESTIVVPGFSLYKAKIVNKINLDINSSCKNYGHTEKYENVSIIYR